MELNPSLSIAYQNRGQANYEKEQYEQSILDFNQAIKIDPQDAGPYNARAKTYSQLKKYSRAIEDYDRAIELESNNPIFYSNRGNAYSRMGEYDRATEDQSRAMRLNPEDPQAYYNQGQNMLAGDHFEEAIRNYEMAIEVDPEYDQAHANLAWVLATAPELIFRDGSRAVLLARIALELKDTPNHRAILAAALAETGQFQEAVREQQKALETFKSAGGIGNVESYQANLNLYKNNKPYRSIPGEYAE